MTDLVIPAALKFASSSFRYIDNTGIARGAYTGVTQTTSLGGDRVGASLTFRKSGGKFSPSKSERAQMMAFIMATRSRQNRVYIADAGYKQRGTWPSIAGGEMFTNADFSNGTTGWSTDTSKHSISAADGVLRVTVADGNTGANAFALYQSINTYTQYAPYVVRGLMQAGQGSWPLGTVYRYLGNGISSFPTDGGYGIDSDIAVASTSNNTGFYNVGNSGYLAGDYFEFPFVSSSRCFVADGYANLLLRSDEFSDAAWSKSSCTITADLYTSGDGTTTMDSLVEGGGTDFHYVDQAVTGLSASAADYVFAVVIAIVGRNFAFLEMSENAGGGSSITQAFSLVGSGAVGSSGATGAGWSNRRAFVKNIGSNRILCVLVGRKTSAATQITFRVGSLAADSLVAHASSGTDAIGIWRATAAQSGLPVRLSQSTSAAIAATSQTGGVIFVKGLPVSQSSLLVAGDWVEIDGQLKMLTAALNSDALGCGYLQFSPSLRRSVSDNTPIIVHRPMGRFIFTGDAAGWDNEPGVFSSASLEFEEAFA